MSRKEGEQKRRRMAGNCGNESASRSAGGEVGTESEPLRGASSARPCAFPRACIAACPQVHTAGPAACAFLEVRRPRLGERLRFGQSWPAREWPPGPALAATLSGPPVGVGQVWCWQAPPSTRLSRDNRAGDRPGEGARGSRGRRASRRGARVSG